MICNVIAKSQAAKSPTSCKSVAIFKENRLAMAGGVFLDPIRLCLLLVDTHCWLFILSKLSNNSNNSVLLTSGHVCVRIYDSLQGRVLAVTRNCVNTSGVYSTVIPGLLC